MFLLRPQFALAVQGFERQREVPTRFGRLDDFVDETPSGRHIRIGECLSILFDQFLAARDLVVRGLDFMAEHDFGRALRAHHRHFRCRPREHAIGAQSLAAHGQVRAAVGLSQDYGDLRNRRRRVGEEQFGAVTDDAAVLLLHARQESGHVHEGQQRNIKRIAEAYEARRLVRRIDVQHARASQAGWR